MNIRIHIYIYFRICAVILLQIFSIQIRQSCSAILHLVLANLFVCFRSFSDCKCISVLHFADSLVSIQFKIQPDATIRIVHQLSASLSSHISMKRLSLPHSQVHCRTYPAYSILKSHYTKSNIFFLPTGQCSLLSAVRKQSFSSIRCTEREVLLSRSWTLTYVPLSSTYCLTRANGLLHVAAIQDRNSPCASDCCHLSPVEAHLDILARGVGREEGFLCNQQISGGNTWFNMPCLLIGRTVTQKAKEISRMVWCCHVLHEALKLCDLFLLKQHNFRKMTILIHLDFETVA